MVPAIKAENISKQYRKGQRLASLWDLVTSSREREGADYHWALQAINFEVLRGEALGIIGPNGAGKTTLLKILAKVTRPTAGQFLVNGRFSALIALGAGFHPDLSGRENIYLNGTILGMSKAEINARFDEIVSFAGIEAYLDTPVKRYSSGMFARLGFSIAAHVEPDVLLVDEVLAVGDYAFQQKCHARMDELRADGTSLIFVSHNMDAVRRVCDKGLVLYQGESVFQGGAAEAVIAYSDVVREAARIAPRNVPSSNGLAQRVMTFEAEIERVQLLNNEGHPTSAVHSGESATVCVNILFHQNVNAPIFSMTIRTPSGFLVYDTTTRWQKMDTPDFLAGQRCQVEFALELPLLDGEYDLGVDVVASDFRYYYDRLERALGFSVKGPPGAQGLVNLEAQIAVHQIEQNGAKG